MDEAQIKELIASEVGKALGDVEKLLQPVTESLSATLTEYLNESVGTLEERLTAIEEVATAPVATQPTPETPEGQTDGAKGQPNPLEARLQELERQLADAKAAQEAKDREASQLRFNSTLDSVLDSFQPNQKPLVKELLATRYQGAAQETDKGFLVDGKTLQELATEFFGSDSGKYFLPSNYSDGAGTPKPGRSKPAATADLDAALLQHFSG